MYGCVWDLSLCINLLQSVLLFETHLWLHFDPKASWMYTKKKKKENRIIKKQRNKSNNCLNTCSWIEIDPAGPYLSPSTAAHTWSHTCEVQSSTSIFTINAVSHRKWLFFPSIVKGKLVQFNIWCHNHIRSSFVMFSSGGCAEWKVTWLLLELLKPLMCDPTTATLLYLAADCYLPHISECVSLFISNLFFFFFK